MSLALPPSGSEQPRGTLSPAAQADRLLPALGVGGPPVAEPPALKQTITPGALLAALRRRWQTALGVALVLGAGFAAAVWVLRPDKYTSVALLQVSSAELKVIQEGSRSNDGGIYMRTQLALIKSRPVLQDAVSSAEVRSLRLVAAQSDPVEWLEKQLVVEQVPSTELVRVSMSSRGSGDDLRPIVHAVVRSYMSKSIEVEVDEKFKHLELLKTIALNYQIEIDKQRSSLKSAMTLNVGATSSDPKIVAYLQSNLMEQHSDAKRRERAIESQKQELQLKIDAARARLERPAPKEAGAPNDRVDPLLERELDLDPRIAAADKKVSDLRERIQEFELRAAPTTTARGMFQQPLAEAEKAAAAIRAERRKELVARNQKLVGENLKQLVADCEAERNALEQRLRDCQDYANGLNAQITNLGIDAIEVENKRNRIARAEQFLGMIWEQKERLTLEIQGDKTTKSIARKRVREVAPAEKGEILNKFGRHIEAAGGGVFGVLFGLLTISVLDHRRNRIHSPADVSKGLRLRVIGALPKLSGAQSASLARSLAESVDALRTTLLHLHSAPQGTVLMVASSGAGEGKTTLATALAASLARARCRTLIVDCDLRAPSLHRLFGVAQTPGVCEVLSRTARVEAVIRPTAAECLDVLAAGEMSEAAAAGLASPGAVQRLIEELRGRYDFIVIDSSPLMLVPDAMMVAGCVDGLLYSVRPGISRVAEVHAGYERLREHRMPFLGVVVNGVPQSHAYAPGYGRSIVPVATVVETGQPL
ncbi:tyrosine-protein kinase domain-containing protein [Frigoriglobus tundricola]|uniref:AAA domain-containing protein n=1 Tax=Frigoriglobus tundricola TaxID=2774151 RepID=A0A6M5Z0K7_9BACT|nr:tyrosine-protein kinase domain-containing protein [Frigoriglobus tundricola]QJW99688.1 hypothetical protein FTUN_7309 [Frigoriglobus tundricola]